MPAFGIELNLDILRIREMDAQIARVDTAMADLPSSTKKAITEKEVLNFLTGAMSRLRETLRAEPEALRNHFRQVIQDITLTKDRRGPVYQVTGDIGLFTTPEEGVEQSIRLESGVLHYTIPISLKIVPYRNKRRNKVTTPAAVRVPAENMERSQALGVEAIWRKVVAIDTQAFLEAGIASLKKRDALQVGLGSECHNPHSEEYLYLSGFGGLRLAAMAA